jgi:hypothetical protein
VRLTAQQQPTFVFRAPSNGPVRFSVRQVAPVCRAAGAFTVHGRRGVNRLRFSGRVGGHRLASGTYLIRARHGRKTVFEKTVVVGSGAPTANVCPRGASSSTGGSSTGGSSSGASDAAAHPRNRSAAGGSAGGIGQPRRSGVLGAHASKLVPGSGGTEFALLIVLAAAIFLLGLGSLPRQVVPHPAAAALLARRRALVAAAGFAALTAFLISYFVG